MSLGNASAPVPGLSMSVVIALIAETLAEFGRLLAASFHGGVVGANVNAAFAVRTALDSNVGVPAASVPAEADALVPDNRLRAATLLDKLTVMANPCFLHDPIIDGNALSHVCASAISLRGTS